MNSSLKVFLQLLFVIVLDIIVVGWIYIESEKWKSIQAAAKAKDPTYQAAPDTH